MRPRVLLDCDGVIADFASAVINRIIAVTGKVHKTEEFVSWDLVECLGYDRDTCRTIYDTMKDPGFCRSIRPFPDAVDGVRRLRERCDVYIVTAPFGGKNWHSEREEWLQVHLGIGRHQVAHVHDKWIVSGDFLIDDKTSTLVRWRDAHPQGTPILFQRSYNKNDGWDGITVPNWDRLLSVVEDLL